MTTTTTPATIIASYTRPGVARVIGRWHHRGGCLHLGEVTVFAARGVLRFSSVTPMSADALAGYTTDDYLTRQAARFVAR